MSALFALSRREAEVLQHLANHGGTNQQIARVFGVSTYTIRTHLGRIRSKIGVGTRASLVAWAWRHGDIVGEGRDRVIVLIDER